MKHVNPVEPQLAEQENLCGDCKEKVGQHTSVRIASVPCTLSAALQVAPPPGLDQYYSQIPSAVPHPETGEVWEGHGAQGRCNGCAAKVIY
jgi:hypothetical protein